GARGRATIREALASGAVLLRAHAQRVLREPRGEAGGGGLLEDLLARLGRGERAWVEVDAQRLVAKVEHSHRVGREGQGARERGGERQEFARIAGPGADAQ